MLQKIIKNIRSKPESVRKGITLSVSLGITTIIAFFWFISFLNYSNQILTAKPKIESPTSFLSKMSTLIGESYANVRTKIGAGTSFVEGDMNIQNENASTSEDVFTTDVVAEDNNVDVESNNSSNNSSKSLNDILNTKKQVNQENKATTSSEVLVQ
ncbi:MAG: hypothetical protein K9M11_01755 [Candidatus Pacebacteria bacterium]|nr:hypothetical protein [Candidatus Paceibacterota bacterium]